eukprot:4765012-Amphidinium_carterae.1
MRGNTTINYYSHNINLIIIFTETANEIDLSYLWTTYWRRQQLTQLTAANEVVVVTPTDLVKTT